MTDLQFCTLAFTRPHGEWGRFLPLSAPTERAGEHNARQVNLKQHSQRQGEVDDQESVRVFDRRASCVRPPQVIHANRLLVRFQRGCHGRAPGDRWQDLSGRTKDQSIGYISRNI